MTIKHIIALMAFLSAGFGLSNVQAQVRAGTYSILTLGTAGSHAQDPGSKGTMTVNSRGGISGSVYSYQDGTTSSFTGSVNLATGRGTISEGERIFDIRSKTYSRTWADISYTKRGTTSKGLIWGIR